MSHSYPNFGRLVALRCGDRPVYPLTVVSEGPAGGWARTVQARDGIGTYWKHHDFRVSSSSVFDVVEGDGAVSWLIEGGGEVIHHFPAVGLAILDSLFEFTEGAVVLALIGRLVAVQVG